MKIIFINYNFKTGGISSSLYNLLSKLENNSEFDIEVCLLNNLIDNQFKDIVKKFKVFTPSIFLDIYYTPLKDIKSIRNIHKLFIKILIKVLCVILGDRQALRFIMKLTRLDKKYDIAISFSNDIWSEGFAGGCNDFTKLCVKANKKIGWIHNDPIKLGFTYDICKKTYRDFDVIVNVSNDCKNKFNNIIPDYIKKSKVVYNTFIENQIIELSNKFNPYDDDNKIKLVTVARAENNQKRLDRIIKVSKNLVSEGKINFEWTVIGDGPDLDTLRSDVNKLGLDRFVKFLGNKNNPYPYIKNADCFILTSDFESYGMVIREALILRTPVITTEYMAAYEIISNGFNGLICKNDYDDLFKCVNSTIFSQNKLEYLKRNLEEDSFYEDESIKQFLDVIGSE